MFFIMILNFLRRNIKKIGPFYNLCKGICYLLEFSAGSFVVFVFLVKSKFLLSKLLKNNKKFELYLMHSCGGGTEVYVQNTIHKKNGYILMRNYKIMNLWEVYSLEFGGSDEKIYISFKDILTLDKIVWHVYIENLYSYKKVWRMLNQISLFSAKISFNVHDFYSTCYNVNMVYDDFFCGESCISSCQKKIDGRCFNPVQWRELWRTFFCHVDEFCFFSESSMKIFTTVYNVDKRKVVVKPHNMCYFKARHLKALPDEMNVGVFGAVNGVPKGYHILKSFAEFSKGREYKIHLNGTVSEPNSDVFSNNPNFVDHGRYKPEEIYDRIISQKIGVVFFTSVCPETFSYLVSELMMTGIPIVCFDVGAQAEKIRKYPLGNVISDFSNESIRCALRECYDYGVKYYKAMNMSKRN